MKSSSAMTLEHQADYVRSDELADALVPIENLPELFGVSDRTIRTWIKTGNIELHAYPPSQFGHPHGKAIRFGDVPLSSDTTRWKRKHSSGRSGSV